MTVPRLEKTVKQSLTFAISMQVNLYLPLCQTSMDLSNDPGKNYSIFYCSAAIRFSHVETVVFSDEEFINRWKAGL